jgi:hypothetical protein
MLCGVEEYRVFEPHRHIGNIAFYVSSMWTMFLCGKESGRRILCGPLRALRLNVFIKLNRNAELIVFYMV